MNSNLSPRSETNAKTEMIAAFLEKVPQWRDDVLMQSLFANLPNSDAKPEAFVQKYTFWKDLLTRMTREHLLGPSVFRLPTRELELTFVRKGLSPICLPAVLQEMQKRDLWQDYAAFSAEAPKRNSWIAFSSFVVSSVKSGMSWMVSDADDDSADNVSGAWAVQLPSQVVLLTLLKEQKQMLREHMASSPDNLNSALPLTFDEFLALVNESRRADGMVEVIDRDDALMLLRYLKQEKVLNFAPHEIFDTNSCTIKMGPYEISQVDRDIVKMKLLNRKLDDQVRELNKQITDLKEEAVRFLQIGDRRLAGFTLKRKSLLEKLQLDRLGSLHSIEAILLKISSVSSEAMILQAYKSGSETLDRLLRTHGLTTESAEDAIDQLQEVMAGHDEISAVLTQELTSPIDEDELSAELAALIEEQQKPLHAVAATLNRPASLQLDSITRSLDECHVSEPEDDRMVEPKRQLEAS
jgi:charged multivesicular body protein 7